VCQCDTPEGLYEAPTDTEIAGFVGEANLVPGVLLDGSVRTAFGELACECRAGEERGAGDAMVLIRPEQVKLCPCGLADGRAGLILEREYHGHDSVVKVRPDCEGAPPVILARLAGRVPYQVGSSVTVSVEGPVLAWRVDTKVAAAGVTVP
jgi:iron(III) transport system ATP-binding protein